MSGAFGMKFVSQMRLLYSVPFPEKYVSSSD
jgi:hypothetical protein